MRIVGKLVDFVDNIVGFVDTFILLVDILGWNQKLFTLLVYKRWEIVDIPLRNVDITEINVDNVVNILE